MQSQGRGSMNYFLDCRVTNAQSVGRKAGEDRRIRDISDHATFRGKGVYTGLVRQAWG